MKQPAPGISNVGRGYGLHGKARSCGRCLGGGGVHGYAAVVGRSYDEVPHEQGQPPDRHAACGRHETQEVGIVPAPDAVVHERAMMVQVEDTIVALDAMGCPRRPKYPASPAPSVALPLQLVRNRHLDLAFDLLRHTERVVAQRILNALLGPRGQDDLPSRDDPRIRAAREQQKEQRQDETEHGNRADDDRQLAEEVRHGH
mmetsp:Transcript_82929/g.239914  ORF Transcript_82929/g.239914 Transcript_82929/m.239914 type:complete len:201 (+) Transcript_82929:388-990(+)